jgi:hypothetical protein
MMQLLVALGAWLVSLFALVSVLSVSAWQTKQEEEQRRATASRTWLEPEPRSPIASTFRHTPSRRMP